ncbi:nucleoside/nucleotide kinase family protein [Actinoalloteichus hymeniacidonis]|uniref:Thymidylate kinase n=1 Tax=Actinoalloteichus hymeniacidonis TaxID=340345 RepID=A0AAC9HPF3_9PSEU|nr:hypothetical protein [Actinoalloteichus hymeniacidonis]AOS62888.1 thymidylate kinase [Actinoalloteichus hymeniacidonis]MBB5909079.1 dTMP kinase [Actinoalloteichus hymeniacidonis]
MRILVDGLDMTGKSTLTELVVRTLEARGVPARRHRGLISIGALLEPLRSPLRPFRLPRRTLASTTFLLAGYALDALLTRVLPYRHPRLVLVQDGYVDRCVASGIAAGPYAPARWALRLADWFVPFDLAVYLHAPPDERAARLAERADADTNDRHSVADPAFAAEFTQVLIDGMGPRHDRLLVFDTTTHSVEETARIIVDTLLSDPRRARDRRRSIIGDGARRTSGAHLATGRRTAADRIAPPPVATEPPATAPE